MTRILFVCTGNICRSPTAEGVLRHLANVAGRGGEFHVDSAGTHDYHAGSPPDRRAQQHALSRGYDISSLRARQVRATDFTDFDLVLVMDRMNLHTLQRVCPAAHRAKIRLLMSFGSDPTQDEVPDPYGGEDQGFEQVLDLVEDAARGLLRKPHTRAQPA